MGWTCARQIFRYHNVMRPNSLKCILVRHPSRNCDLQAFLSLRSIVIPQLSTDLSFAVSIERQRFK